ncbi:MAG TPA: hypothetical protein VMW56_17045, partial [Candidatus Margulisiibacteriota bacterium]|nr:hypothetical protein [Candidatus Margulisiibacteriota bacterium]
HPHAQRLRVLRGALLVCSGRRAVTLRPESRPLTVRVGCAHETRALTDTWVAVESWLPQKHRRRSD